MEELLERIAKCVELGKINEKTPYPPAMKGQPGADELTLQALNEGISPSDILQKGLIVGMERIGVKFKANQVFVPPGADECQGNGNGDESSQEVL
ncbi:B12-binding domain-containing protein [Phocaeicola coprophilus]|uniref:B12-binding domain-containing protein n=1 Tax=Phocaeicola coprophilus TaxID=387090 RepID=UPI003AF0DBA3